MSIQHPLLIRAGRATSLPISGLVGVAWLVALYSAFAFIILVIGLLSGLSYDNPMLTGTIIGFLLIAPVIWYRPSVGVFILLMGAAVFETFPLGFPDSITDRSIFFQAFRSSGAPGFMLFNGAELIIGFSLASVILHRVVAKETRPLVFGRLFWAVGFYTAMVVFGLLHGLASGGDFNSAIWEARGQLYIILTYLIVINTIENKAQIKRLFWLFLIGIAIKGILGSWRYLVTLGADLQNMDDLAEHSNSLLAHEESFFFALLIVFGYILFMFRSSRAQLFFISIVSLPVAIAFLANQRRIGTLILIIGIMLSTIVAFHLLKTRRKLIIMLILLGIMLAPGYLAATWNSSSSIAQPTRAIRSAIDPNARDDSSDAYRAIETQDLIYNIQIDPLRGQGYGKSIIFFIPIPNISHDFYWWDIIPHNTVLWVWLRLGFIGFAAFWFLVGRTIIESMIAAKNAADPYLQSVGVFAVVVVVSWVFMGLLDQGLVDFRETILIGTLIGLISLFPKLEEEPEQQVKAESPLAEFSSSGLKLTD